MMKSKSKYFKLFASVVSGSLLTLLLSGLTSCVVTEDDLSGADAWHEVYRAIEYKAEKCGNRPDYMLIPPANPPEYGTRLCSLTIINLECPFDDYPLFCLEMYNIDVPGIGP